MYLAGTLAFSGVVDLLGQLNQEDSKLWVGTFQGRGQDVISNIYLIFMQAEQRLYISVLLEFSSSRGYEYSECISASPAGNHDRLGVHTKSEEIFHYYATYCAAVLASFDHKHSVWKYAMLRSSRSLSEGHGS